MSDQKIDAATLFNTHMADWGLRVNAFVNYLLIVSGGVLTITVGAFLNGSPPRLGLQGLFAIQCGWYLLTGSLVFALSTVFMFIIAQRLVIGRWKEKLKREAPALEVIEGKVWFRIVIWIALALAFLCCVSGLGFISYGASQLLRLP